MVSSYLGFIGFTCVEPIHWPGRSIRFGLSLPKFLSYLFSVAAISTDDVWAAGGRTLGSLMLHWDGFGWQVMQDAGTGSIASLSALAYNDVWAVGTRRGSGVSHTLIEHWDGVAWAITP